MPRVLAAVVEAGALALAGELRVDAAVAVAVRALAGDDDTALARLWLIAPGDICGSCVMRQECPDRTRCLHLVASAGNPRHGVEDWSGIGGAFRRLPLGVGKVGRVGASRSAMLLHDMSERSNWIAHPDWAAREGVRSFAAQPLVAAAAVLGVVAVFRRSRIDAPDFRWLRVLADHAAAAVVRGRALERVERNRAVLERENTALRARLRQRGATGPTGDELEVPVLSIGEWRQHERSNLEAALRRSGGRIYGTSGAAALLGVPPTTLASRLRALGVPTPGRRGSGPS